MKHIDYEEQYLNLISTVLREGFKLADTTIALHPTLHHELSDYLPLLHTSYVGLEAVNYMLENIIDAIPKEAMNKLAHTKCKPIKLYSSKNVSYISAIVMCDGTLHITATVHEANIVTEVPELFACIAALGVYLCNTLGCLPGSCDVSFNFVTLPHTYRSVVKELLKRKEQVQQYDHPYRRCALQASWEDTQFKVPNYKIGKTCFPAVTYYD